VPSDTRARVLDAARDLLMSSGSVSIDAIARSASVARMTVYYQFGSKSGLIEALFDHLAERGLAARLPAAFGRKRPLEALDAVIETFVCFWASERDVMRRIRGVASVDREVGAAMHAREERRRAGMRTIIERVMPDARAPRDHQDLIDILFTLTSFETYDALAGDTRSPADVALLIRDIAHTLLDAKPTRRQIPV
jgi:AcrR family transcriptional regulator